MTDAHQPAGHAGTPAAWPHDPALLSDTTVCPACFTRLSAPVCGACGLDLRTPRASDLLTAGENMLRIESDRQATIATMRREQAEHFRQAVAAAVPIASPVPIANPVPLHLPPIVAAPAAPAPTPPAPSPTALAPGSTGPRRPGVQILLLTLGIVLVSVAAIFFLFIAYVFASLEVRSIMTAAASLLVLSVAWLLRSRGLRGTAEGVAIIATVLFLLDVWIVRANDLFGTAGIDGRVYSGVALLGLVLVLLGVGTVTRLRTASISAASLAPTGVFLVGLGLLRETTFATCVWGALLAVAALSLAAAMVRPTVERTILLSLGFVAGALALPFAVAAMNGAPWTRVVTFGAVAVIWSAQSMLTGRQPVWPRIASVFAGLSAVLALVVPVLLVDDRELSVWLPATGAFALGVVALALGRRVRGPAALRRAVTDAVWPIGAVGVLCLLPAIGLVLATLVAHTVADVRFAWTVDAWATPIPFAAFDPTGLISNWWPVLAIAMCAIVTYVGLAVAAVRRLAAIPVAMLGLAALGACVHAENLIVTSIALTVLALGCFAALVFGKRRLAASIRMVGAVVGGIATVTVFTTGYASAALWPFSSAVALAILIGARIGISRIAAIHAARVVGPILTGAAAVLGFSVVSAFPAWAAITVGYRFDTGAVDRVFGVAALSAGILLVLAPLSPRVVPRPDAHVLSAVAGIALLAALPGLTLAHDGLVTGRTAQLLVCLVLVTAGILWLLPRTGIWPQRAIFAVVTPISLMAAGLSISESTLASAIIVPSAIVLAGALGIVLFRTVTRDDRSAKTIHNLWDGATALTGVLILGWAAVLPSDVRWVTLLIIAAVPVLLACSHDNPITGKTGRRQLAWAGLPLAVAALWSFLSENGVTDVEPYTLPIAGALLILAVLAAGLRTTTTGVVGRNVLVAVAAAIATIPSILLSIGDAPEGAPRPLTLVIVGALLGLAAALVPVAVRGVRLRLIMASTGVVAALGTGAIQSVLSTQSRGGAGIQLEGWLAPGIACAIVVCVFWIRRADAPSWLPQALVVAVVAVFAIAETIAVGLDQHAGVRALLGICLLGASHVASVLLGGTRTSRLLEWSSLAAMFVIGVSALLTITVDPFELVTVPVALALGAAGFVRMDANPRTRSWPQLGPACGILLIPSLLPDFSESALWRIVGLGVVAIVIIVTAAIRRLQAPLIIASTVLIVHAVAQLWPWISSAYAAVPWWLWLGLGGVILIVLAATYEKRIRNLKTAVVSIGSLR